MWNFGCASADDNRNINKVAENSPVEHKDFTCPRPQENILRKFNIYKEEKEKISKLDKATAEEKINGESGKGRKQRVTMQ